MCLILYVLMSCGHVMCYVLMLELCFVMFDICCLIFDVSVYILPFDH